jgi:hypothetical protein
MKPWRDTEMSRQKLPCKQKLFTYRKEPSRDQMHVIYVMHWLGNVVDTNRCIKCASQTTALSGRKVLCTRKYAKKKLCHDESRQKKSFCGFFPCRLNAAHHSMPHSTPKGLPLNRLLLRESFLLDSL